MISTKFIVFHLHLHVSKEFVILFFGAFQRASQHIFCWKFAALVLYKFWSRTIMSRGLFYFWHDSKSNRYILQNFAYFDAYIKPGCVYAPVRKQANVCISFCIFVAQCICIGTLKVIQMHAMLYLCNVFSDYELRFENSVEFETFLVSI